MVPSARQTAGMCRAAIHWDDADLPKEVVMRPVTSLGSEWHWSGSFKLTTRCNLQQHLSICVHDREMHRLPLLCFLLLLCLKHPPQI